MACGFSALADLRLIFYCIFHVWWSRFCLVCGEPGAMRALPQNRPRICPHDGGMAWPRSDRPGDETTPHRLAPLVRRALLLVVVLSLAAVCGSVAVRLLRAATVSPAAAGT